MSGMLPYFEMNKQRTADFDPCLAAANLKGSNG